MATAKKPTAKKAVPRARKVVEVEAPVKRAYTRKKKGILPEPETLLDTDMGQSSAELSRDDVMKRAVETLENCDPRLQTMSSLQKANCYDLRALHPAERGLFLRMLEDLGYVTESSHSLPSQATGNYNCAGVDLNHTNRLIRFVNDITLNEQASARVLIKVGADFHFGEEREPVPAFVEIDGVKYARVATETAAATAPKAKGFSDSDY